MANEWPNGRDKDTSRSLPHAMQPTRVKKADNLRETDVRPTLSTHFDSTRFSRTSRNALADTSISDSKSIASRQSMASDLSDLLSELLGGSQTRREASARNLRRQHINTSLSDHLARSTSSSRNDQRFIQRSEHTRDSDLSSLLSELLAASMASEDEEDGEQQGEGRMPLLHEDEEYPSVPYHSTDSTSCSSESIQMIDGHLEASLSSKKADCLSSLPATSTPAVTYNTDCLDKHGLRIKGESQRIDKSALDTCSQNKKSKPSKNRERKKSKKSKRSKNEQRLKKKAEAQAAVVDSILNLMEDNQTLPSMKDQPEQQMSPSKGEWTSEQELPLSPIRSDDTPRMRNSNGLQSPTSVSDGDIHPRFSYNEQLQFPVGKQPLQSKRVMTTSAPTSPVQIFSDLPESVQNSLIALHQQWLMYTSQGHKPPVPYIPIQSEEKSISSDITGLSGMFLNGVTQTSAPPLQEGPDACGGYGIEIDGESVTNLWFRPSDNKPNRSIAFSTVHVREYKSILSDHPCCEDGPGIGIDWHYKRERVYGIDIFDAKPGRRHGDELKLTRQEREGILLTLGYTKKDLTKAVMAALRIRDEREQSTIQYSRIQGLDEIIAGAGRKMNRLVAKLNLDKESLM